MATGLVAAVGACSSADGDYIELTEQPTGQAQQIVEEAKDFYDRGLYSLSREKWELIRDNYPASSDLSFAELKIADCYFASRNLESAISSYQEFVRSNPGHEAVAYARLQIAKSYLLLYDDELRDQEPVRRALKQFLDLKEDYPHFVWSQQVEEGIRNSEHLLAKHEAAVAEFYSRMGNTAAAGMRLGKAADFNH